MREMDRCLNFGLEYNFLEPYECSVFHHADETEYLLHAVTADATVPPDSKPGIGHGDIKMTLRYAHLAPEHKAAADAKLTAP